MRWYDSIKTAKSPKKKERQISDADALWMDPQGNHQPVTEHALSIIDKPEWFGVSRDQVNVPQGNDFGAIFQALHPVMKDVIERGYVRYRQMNNPEGTRHNFDVASYKAAQPQIEQILWAKLKNYMASGKDQVFIAQADGKVFEGTVEQVLANEVAMYNEKTLMHEPMVAHRNWSIFKQS